MISFTKLPIYVADSETYHLFDVLLPTEFNEQTILQILSILCKMRGVFTSKQIDFHLSAFLDSQPYITFNHIYLPDVKDEPRVSKDTLKWIVVGDRKFSLSNQETSDFYFHSVCCMLIMQKY